MKPTALTEAQRNLIVMALQEKQQLDAEQARAFNNDRLAKQFERQSSECSLLATIIDQADSIDVRPYSDGDDADPGIEYLDRDPSRERFDCGR